MGPQLCRREGESEEVSKGCMRGRGTRQTSDRSMDDRSVLELDRDRLIRELHEEPDELHRAWCCSGVGE